MVDSGIIDARAPLFVLPENNIQVVFSDSFLPWPFDRFLIGDQVQEQPVVLEFYRKGGESSSFAAKVHNHKTSVALKIRLNPKNEKEIQVQEYPAGTLTQEELNTYARFSISNLASLLRLYNEPTNFVVEYRSSNFDQDNERRKKKKLRRRKPIYLILGREDVVRIITQGDKAKAQKLRAGHMRRGHWRTLHHERYGENVGKRMWIKACWVGSEEVKDEHGATYRVVLDERKL